MSAAPSGGGGAGYDISLGVSEATTQGGSITSPFTVGGGVKIPEWVWYVAAGLAGLILWKKYFK